MFKHLHSLALSSLGLALVFSTGCDTEQPSPSITPDRTTTAKPLDDVAKDLKPPVIIKPNVPPPSTSQRQEPPGATN
jgi:hypothetical protein